MRGCGGCGRKSPLTSTVDHRLATDTAGHTPCAAGYFVARREDIRDDVSAKLEAALGPPVGLVQRSLLRLAADLRTSDSMNFATSRPTGVSRRPPDSPAVT
jgi:hypothetical protein